MQLTKFTHACVRLHAGAGTLVIDPGTLSESKAALYGADAVLITHTHADHLDVATVLAAAQTRPQLRVWGPADAGESLSALGDRFSVVVPGDHFSAAGMQVRAVGGQHAAIHSSVTVPPNVGYLIEEQLYHPGDSLVVPPVPVGTLLIPTSAPWAKLSEMLDFLIAVRAPRALQIHDALWGPIGTAVTESHLSRVADDYGLRFEHLDSGDVRDISDLK